MLLVVLCSLLLFLNPTVADGGSQSFTPLSTWRKPNITYSQQQKIQFAQAAIDVTLNLVDGTTGQFDNYAIGVAADFYLSLIDFDSATNGTNYHSKLVNYFNLWNKTNPNLEDFTYTPDLGYVAIRAFLVYQDTIFLTYAQEAWNNASAYTVSTSQAQSGKTPVKSFSLIGNCQGATMAGGTWKTVDPADDSITALGSGTFLILSCLLFQATNQQQYLDAARLSADFINNHFLSDSSFVTDVITASQGNNACHISSAAIPYNSGIFIEGLTILSSLLNNDTLRTQLSDLVAFAVPFNAWQDDNGIIRNPLDGSGDERMAHALSIVYQHDTWDANLRNYVKAYLSVQYNALLDLATTTGTNWYGANWVGGTDNAPDGLHQASALTVLVGALNFVDNGTPTAQTSQTATQKTDVGQTNGDHTSKDTSGIIAGAVIGGLLALTLVVTAIWFYRRRHMALRRFDNSIETEKTDSGDGFVVPFLVPASNPPITPAAASQDVQSQSTVGSLRASVPPLGSKGRRLPPQPITLPTTQPSYAKGSSPNNSSRPTPMAASFDAPPAPSVAVSSDSGGRSHSSLPSDRNLPMAELVALLSERLQTQAWNDEAPPTYR